MSEEKRVTLKEFWESADVRDAVADGRCSLKYPVEPEDYPRMRTMRHLSYGRQPASGRHGGSEIWLTGRYVIVWLPVNWRSLSERLKLVDYFLVNEYVSAEEALQVFASMSAQYDADDELRRGYPLRFYGGDEVAVVNSEQERHVRSLIDDRYCEERPGAGSPGVVLCRARVDREDLWLVLTEHGAKVYADRELITR